MRIIFLVFLVISNNVFSVLEIEILKGSDNLDEVCKIKETVLWNDYDIYEEIIFKFAIGSSR